MSFLKNAINEMKMEEEFNKLNEEYTQLFKEFQALAEKHNVTISQNAMQEFRRVDEGILDFDPNLTTGELFDEAQKRFNTAKWALGLTNKLKPEDRRKHRKIVLTALNQIRAFLNKLVRKLTVEIEEEDRQASNPPFTSSSSD